jgi:hypothetical protein
MPRRGPRLGVENAVDDLAGHKIRQGQDVGVGARAGLRFGYRSLRIVRLAHYEQNGTLVQMGTKTESSDLLCNLPTSEGFP